MSRKSWHLDRRSFLRGAGVTVALPWLESMAAARPRRRADGEGADAAPKRLAFVYFPNGCSLPAEDDPKHAHWRWFPTGEGRDYRFTQVLEPLQPFRERTSILGGLSHPLSRELLGHLAGDSWLTAGDLRGGHYQNRVSVDQVAARHLGVHTRYPSLVLSTDGGVGYKSRVSTLSFDANGRPIPSEHQQRRIFERYFAPDGGATSDERRRSLRRGRKVVDLVLEESRRLKGLLGARDRHKLEEYMASLDSVEEQIRRNESWLDRPRKPFDASGLDLDPNPKVDPQAYLRATLDLMALAFETDLTRVATEMMAREDGMGYGDNFPRLALDIPRGHHTISHDTHEGHWDDWGRLDQWYAQQFAHFLGRLRDTEDEHGSLLDSTLVLYGSCCSTTHNARNYPLALVGGERLGHRPGAYHRYGEDVPLSNLFVSLLRATGLEAEAFADSTGALEGPFA